MKIEDGKYYRTRAGQKVGPMRFDNTSAKYPWDMQTDLAGCNGVPKRAGGLLWGADGTCEEVRGFDIIAEWRDEPDLTAITTPYGLLDRATQEALKAHGGPWESYGHDGWLTVHEDDGPTWLPYYVWRVKPAPPKPREFHINPHGGVYELHPEQGPVSLPAGWIHVVEKTSTQGETK